MATRPGILNRLLALPLIGLVRLYQLTLGPLMGGHCRFQPTCSAYALEALRTHGGVRGGWLTLRRLARCHPLGGAGFDPVPNGEKAHESVSATSVSQPRG